MASPQTEDTPQTEDKNKLQWSDEMTRFLLELITLEKQAGHSKGKNLSEQGKQNVLKELKNQYPKIILTWNKIKNKLDTLKKQYELYRKITFGSTGLGYNDRTGTVDAPEHWWRDKIKAYPEAAKLRSNPLRFIPLLHVVFREETVVVEESWQPRRGAHRRPPPMELSDNDYTNIDPDEREATRQDDSNDHVQLEDRDWSQQLPLEQTPNLTETDPLETPQQSSFAKAQMKDASHNRKRKRSAVDSTLDRIAATIKHGLVRDNASCGQLVRWEF